MMCSCEVVPDQVYGLYWKVAAAGLVCWTAVRETRNLLNLLFSFWEKKNALKTISFSIVNQIFFGVLPKGEASGWLCVIGM